MHVAEKGTERLNSLLRGERAAFETYQQALDRLRTDRAAPELRHIQREHQEATAALGSQVRLFNGEPEGGSGTWGACARLVEGTATWFGKAAALRALKEGEKLGLRDYRRALSDEDVPDASKEFIRETLLPRTQGHIAALDRLMNQR
jgi:hypothetical protein